MKTIYIGLVVIWIAWALISFLYAKAGRRYNRLKTEYYDGKTRELVQDMNRKNRAKFLPETRKRKVLQNGNGNRRVVDVSELDNTGSYQQKMDNLITEARKIISE